MIGLKIIEDRFDGFCQYIDTCIDYILDNYHDPFKLAKLKEQESDILNTLEEMRKLEKEVKNLAFKYHDDEENLRKVIALATSMVSTMGYISEKLKQISEEMEYIPNNVSDKTINKFNFMNWEVKE